jgi:hypothetical protein
MNAPAPDDWWPLHSPEILELLPTEEGLLEVFGMVEPERPRERPRPAASRARSSIRPVLGANR